jgi:hypothetical protein
MSDALQHTPSFKEMVGLIEKLFKDYLEDVLKSSPEEIKKSWTRYKTLNHLYQDEQPLHAEQLIPGAPTETGTYFAVVKLYTTEDPQRCVLHYQKHKDICRAVGHAFNVEVQAEDVVGYVGVGRQQGAVWVKASVFKTKEPVYRPYRRKREDKEPEYDYGEIYVTEDLGTIFLDIGNERAYEPQHFERWKGYEILDESPAAGREEVDPQEIWDEHSALIGDDIDDLSYWAGKEVMKKEDFLKALQQFKQQKEK